MKSDRERELWLLKVTTEYVDKCDGILTKAEHEEPARPLAHGNKLKWGTIAVASITTASLAFGS